MARVGRKKQVPSTNQTKMIQTYLSTAVLAAIFFFHCSVVLGKESQANFVIEPVQMGGGVAYDAIENDTVPVVYRLFTR